MSNRICPIINVKIVPSKDAPAMLHESVASGSHEDQEFMVIRDFTGLHWQIRMGEKTALFSLPDILKEIISDHALCPNDNT